MVGRIAQARSLIEMEVNLKSQDPYQRTLHWIVDGAQQVIFICGVPDRVEFAVLCSSLLISLILYICISMHIYTSTIFLHLQLTTRVGDEEIEFISLEELREPRVEQLLLEKGCLWNKYDHPPTTLPRHNPFHSNE